MTPDETTPLPTALHDELVDILFRDAAHRRERLAALLAGAGPHREALQAHIAAHQRDEAASAARLPGSPEVPGYRILDKLGEGGMGAVYRAEQLAPLVRHVAIKVIRPGMDTHDMLARFERERQALAAMDHDAIARVYDCGHTLDGQPFISMELVIGQPIDRWCDSRQKSVAGRVALFLQVCRGVQHAHQKGVVHRDLKPSNILVVEQSGEPRVKVIDFGVARAVADGPADGAQTAIGLRIGTPDYMSPEQAAGRQELIDTRSDVYSLGVVLHELLCGALPRREPAAAGADTPPAEPVLPSARLRDTAQADQLAQKRRLSVTGLVRRLRGDLDWIVCRALAAAPERRYPTAIALAEDLQRHLDGKPVEAGPPSPWYRLRKAVHRHRVVLAASALVVAVASFGFVNTADALSRFQASHRRLELLTETVLLQDARREAAQLHAADSSRLPALQAWMARHADPLPATIERVRADLRDLSLVMTDADLAPDLQQYLQQRLEEFITDAEALLANEVPDVRARLRWAQQIRELSLHHPNARATWEQARAAIRAADGVTASRLYAQVPIDLKPHEGLVPIGCNPKTLLWEFYDLRSAFHLRDGPDPATLAVPAHDAEGNVAVDEHTGIVFVLLPGGTFTFGAQELDPAAPNHVPPDAEHSWSTDGRRFALPTDVRSYQVTLAPFFLARHEVSQAQWLRLAGTARQCYYPLGFQPGPAFPPVTAANPVESVSWTDCDALLRRHGMLLPTVAQWEYGCRAGTTTPWAFGRDPGDLVGKVNLLDAATQRIVGAGQWAGTPYSAEDGHVVHAAIGGRAANAFGMHDMHGNVSEWCRDGGDDGDKQFAPDDGAQPDRPGLIKRGLRGGSFTNAAVLAATWYDSRGDANSTLHNLGCRAARPLEL